jgi:hypothetical protein
VSVVGLTFRYFWINIFKSTPDVAPGTWVHNATGVQISYTDWEGTEPNDASLRCCVTDRDYSYQWRDAPCTGGSYAYICKK